jgi:copper transport protein
LKALIVLLLVAAGLVLGGHGAFAHATLITSEPVDGAVLRAPPRQVHLSFGEPVTPLVMRLLTADGRVITLANVRVERQALIVELPAGVATGTSILSWRVTSSDGHPIGGTVTFSVNQASLGRPAEPAADPASRFLPWLLHVLALIGLAAVVGGAVFQAWIASPRLAGLDRILMFAAPLAGAVALARFGADVVDAVGGDLADLMNVALWWRPVSRIFGGSVLAMLAALALSALSVRSGDRWPRRLSAAALLCAGLAFATSGHAAAATPQYLMKPAIVLHIAAVLFWSGSLVPLLMLARAGSMPAAGVALTSFAMPVLAAVIVLTVSGLLLGGLQLGALAELWNSGYGVVLCLKLAALLPLLALAALNRLVLTPRVRSGDSNALRPLRISIAAEIAIVVVIFGLVSLWRFTPPPREMAAVRVLSTGLQFHAHGTRGMANLIVSPARAGPVKVSINVMDVQARPLEVAGVDLVLTDPERRIESIRRKARRVTSANWQIDDLTIPVPGTWLVRIDLLVSDFEKIPIRTTLKVDDWP